MAERGERVIGSGEMAPWLRQCTALAEAWVQFPAPREIPPALPSEGTCAHRHTPPPPYIQITISKINLFLKKKSNAEAFVLCLFLGSAK